MPAAGVRMRRMPTSELLTIAEVDQVNRVMCQAEGCGHGVYRRIHVVRCEDAVDISCRRRPG
jgi:hypothetical protein